MTSNHLQALAPLHPFPPALLCGPVSASWHSSPAARYAWLPDLAGGEKAFETNQAVTSFFALTPPIAPNGYLGCPSTLTSVHLSPSIIGLLVTTEGLWWWMSKPVFIKCQVSECCSLWTDSISSGLPNPFLFSKHLRLEGPPSSIQLWNAPQSSLHLPPSPKSSSQLLPVSPSCFSKGCCFS